MPLFTIPTQAEVDAALAKAAKARPVGPIGRATPITKAERKRRHTTISANTIASDTATKFARIERALAHAEWSRWRPQAVCVVFNRLHCDCCGSVTLVPATKLLIRWTRTDDPEQQWFIEAHPGLHKNWLATLPRETHTHEDNAAACSACWPTTETLANQLDLFGKPAPAEWPRYLHPHPRRQKELNALLGAKEATMLDLNTNSHHRITTLEDL
jgi:hypothetical protein